MINKVKIATLGSFVLASMLLGFGACGVAENLVYNAVIFLRGGSVFAPGVDLESMMVLRVGMSREELLEALGEPLSKHKAPSRRDHSTEVWVYAKPRPSKDGLLFEVVLDDSGVQSFLAEDYDMVIYESGNDGLPFVAHFKELRRAIPD